MYRFSVMKTFKKSLCLYTAIALFAPLGSLCIGKGYFFMEHKYKIYILIDPTTNETRYVGQTILSLTKRLMGHLCLRKEHFNNKKDSWIRELKSKGLKPEIYLIDESKTAQECLEAEKFWIRYLRFVGCNLTNGNNGGVGSFGCNLTEDGRRRIIEASKGRPSPLKGIKGVRKLTEKTKKEISIRQQGRGNSMFGKNQSPLLKHRYSIERKGNANYFFGKQHTNSTKEKISKSSLQPERRKISAENIKTYIKWIKLKSKHNQLYIKFPSPRKRKK